MRKTIDDLLSNMNDLRLLIADLGHFPAVEKRGNLIDVGFKETLMFNMACGLSRCGIRPYIYSLAGFALYRGFEQLKYNILAKNERLTIFNGGAGFCYHNIGPGHYLVDDFALLGALPNVRIFTPINKLELIDVIYSTHKESGLTYIRLGLEDERVIDDSIKIKDENCYFLEEFDPQKPVLITMGWLSNYHHKFNSHRFNIFHVKELTELHNYVKFLSSLNVKITIVEDHIYYGGLSFYLRNLKIDEHFYLPKGISGMQPSKEDFWSLYNLDLKDEVINERI